MRRWGKKRLLRALILFLLLDILAASVLIVFIGRDRRALHTGRDKLAREIGVTEDMGTEEQEERFAIAVGEVSRCVTMRSEPEVRDGRAGLCLANAAESSCAVSVELVLFAGGESLAESGLIEPGWYLEELALDTTLEPGEYPCLARCNFYTVEGNVFLGHSTRQLLLRVGGCCD